MNDDMIEIILTKSITFIEKPKMTVSNWRSGVKQKLFILIAK